MTPHMLDYVFAGRIGVARRDITPPLGIYSRNWGAATRHTAEGVHRPLTATVLAILADHQSSPLILVALDLGWFKTPSDEWMIRGPLLEGLQIDPSRVMICISHTHAGPAICLGDAGEPGGALIEPYMRGLGPILLEAARQAIAQAQPALLDWGYGLCDLATNRDMIDPDDPDKYVVGYNPSAPADATLLVGRVTAREDGRTIATIVNYACHPTTLAWDNHLTSPDYVGTMRQTVEAATDAPCLFLQGASGDLAPAMQYTGDVAVADGHGVKLGHAVLATMFGMRPPGKVLQFDRVVESGARLGVWSDRPAQVDTTVEAIETKMALPAKAQPTEDEVLKQLAKATDSFMQERLRRKLHLVRFLGGKPTCDMSLWVWRVGGALLFGQPNEPYSQWQIALRQHWARRPVVAMNLVNGSCGYLVPKEKCHPHRYTYWQSLFAADAFSVLQKSSLTTGDALIDSAVTPS
ncbi:MAG: hypothetical protein IT448_11405 [Phycisphaerales bacterium]|nr:hypothetical protein [Phycisphaerales bacterium]